MTATSLLKTGRRKESVQEAKLLASFIYAKLPALRLSAAALRCCRVCVSMRCAPAVCCVHALRAW
jgi:hypothetical protein